MRTVTLDTNVYVSALNFGGGPAQLLGLAQAGIIRIDISDAIIAEIHAADDVSAVLKKHADIIARFQVAYPELSLLVDAAVESRANEEDLPI